MPQTLHSIAEIQSSAAVRAGTELPVDMEAVVTYVRGYERTLFVQQDDHAIFVLTSANMGLQAGDRIRVRGRAYPSFRPIVLSTSIEVLDHTKLPNAVTASYRDLIQSRYDCRLVKIRGTIRGANIVVSGDRQSSRLYISTSAGLVEAAVDSNDPAALREFLDAEVEVTGVASGIFDGKWEMTGILLHLGTLQTIQVLHKAHVDPWTLPLTPMDRVLNQSQVQVSTPRVQVRGVITYFQPGTALVLQDGQHSMWIQTHDWRNLHVGHVASAIGIPEVHNGFLSLMLAEAREESAMTPVTPLATHWNDLTNSQHIFDLVTLEGVLVTAVHESAQDEYVIQSDGHLVTAIFRHPWEKMKPVQPGSRLRVTGVCIPEDANPFNGEVPFSILLRTFEDVAVVAQPSPLTVRNLLDVIGLLTLVLFLLFLRGWYLERKIRRQTAAIAARNQSEASLERQRSQVLEMINSSRPLEDILRRITAVASAQLIGAYCWFESSDGAVHGTAPQSPMRLRQLELTVWDRMDQRLGTIRAAFTIESDPQQNDTDTIAGAAQLIAMAIETQRLNADLRHRSEYDQLTDTHNRFSFDRYLQDRIDDVKLNQSSFALLYLDLDDFKQVNDQHGHHVGDLLLQVVAQRIESHLRGHDMLARLGGDEFALLIPGIRHPQEAEEIMQRILAGFEAPVHLNGLLLKVSFSVGYALCPGNGTSQDALLATADQAMYREKSLRRELRENVSPENPQA